MKENLIEPIETIGYNRCPKCRNLMFIADSEMSYIQIDKEGYPINQQTEYYRCQAVCAKCQSAYDMINVGMRYRPASKLLDFISAYERNK